MRQSDVIPPHKRSPAFLGEWMLELMYWLFLGLFLFVALSVKGILVLRCILLGGHDWLEPVDEDVGDGLKLFDFGRPDTVCRRGCGCRK